MNPQPTASASFTSRLRHAITDRGYLRFALPGVVLLIVSAVFWGRAPWIPLIQLVGVGLVVIPFPSTSSRRTDRG